MLALSLRTALICCVALGASTAPAQTLPKPKSQQTVSYGTHKRQYFRITHAAGSGPRPVMIYFFGGGFVLGSPNYGPFKGDWLNAGITVVAAGYRFRQDGASKREIMEDGARVVQYLRLHARRFNIDPNRIGVAGYSSGGVIASWVALHDDLANPASPDPVLRQSSRVSACCLEGSQVHPLKLAEWERYTGSDRTLLQLGIFNFILLRLDGSMFRNPIQRTDYATDAEYQAALDAYERDVFGFYLASRDDPPVAFYCNQTDDPNAYVRKKNGGGLHSPLLMIPLERKLKELRVPVSWGRKEVVRPFVHAGLTL